MRVLWLCNTVPPEICDILGFKKRYFEGWISGMLSEMKRFNDIELSICIPIRKPEKMRDGETKDYTYYSFLSAGIENDTELQIDRFCEIIRDFSPDVVHIWGSEYGTSLSMIKACNLLRISSKVVVHIQGLASAIVSYNAVNIPKEWIDYIGENGRTIAEDNERMIKRGENELVILSNVKNVLGRTEWDKNYIKSINRNIRYRYSGEILRDQFYKTECKWSINKCERHSIFITQGGYAIKGIHLIIPAVAMLKDKYPDIKVYISGNSTLANSFEGMKDSYGEYLAELMKHNVVEEQFEFVGPLSTEQMIERYMKTNVLVVSSTIENSSNSIGEAQILGVPVVATYTGGTPSLIEHGKTGLLYQMDAPYMFAAFIERVFDDDAFAMELSKNEWEIAKKRYDPQIISMQLHKTYRELVNA